MRRVLFWMHLAAGLLISALVLFFAITGSLLAYERPILRALDQHAYQAAGPAQEAVRMPLAQLLPLAMQSLPGPVEAVTIHADPTLPVELQAANRGVYFANPYTAQVQGPIAPRARAFFAQVTALHRWFGLANAKRFHSHPGERDHHPRLLVCAHFGTSLVAA